MKIRLLLFLSSTLLSIHTWARDHNLNDTTVVQPGSPLIDYQLVKNHVLRLNFSVVDKGQISSLGIYVDSVFISKEPGVDKRINRIATFSARGLKDTACYDYKSLTPLSNYESTPQLNTQVDYDTHQINIEKRIPKKDSVVSRNSVTPPTAVFDGYTNDFILRFIKSPKKGMVYKMPMFSFGREKISWIAVNITGEVEEQTKSGKKAKCWLMTLTWLGTSATTDFYIRKSDRALIKMHQVISGSGREVVKELIE